VIAKEAQGIETEFQAGAPCFIRQDFRMGQLRVIADLTTTGHTTPLPDAPAPEYLKSLSRGDPEPSQMC